MKRQKELNEKTLEKAKKELERVLFLQEKIRKAEEEIAKIKESNNWVHYTGKDFCNNSTEEQEIEFWNIFKEIS